MNSQYAIEIIYDSFKYKESEGVDGPSAYLELHLTFYNEGEGHNITDIPGYRYVVVKDQDAIKSLSDGFYGKDYIIDKYAVDIQQKYKDVFGLSIPIKFILLKINALNDVWEFHPETCKNMFGNDSGATFRSVNKSGVRDGGTGHFLSQSVCNYFPTTKNADYMNPEYILDYSYMFHNFNYFNDTYSIPNTLIEYLLEKSNFELVQGYSYSGTPLSSFRRNYTTALSSLINYRDYLVGTDYLELNLSHFFDNAQLFDIEYLTHDSFFSAGDVVWAPVKTKIIAEKMFFNTNSSLNKLSPFKECPMRVTIFTDKARNLLDVRNMFENSTLEAVDMSLSITTLERGFNSMFKNADCPHIRLAFNNDIDIPNIDQMIDDGLFVDMFQGAHLSSVYLGELFTGHSKLLSEIRLKVPNINTKEGMASVFGKFAAELKSNSYFYPQGNKPEFKGFQTRGKFDPSIIPFYTTQYNNVYELVKGSPLIADNIASYGVAQGTLFQHSLGYNYSDRGFANRINPDKYMAMFWNEDTPTQRNTNCQLVVNSKKVYDGTVTLSLELNYDSFATTGIVDNGFFINGLDQWEAYGTEKFCRNHSTELTNEIKNRFGDASSIGAVIIHVQMKDGYMPPTCSHLFAENTGTISINGNDVKFIQLWHPINRLATPHDFNQLHCPDVLDYSYMFYRFNFVANKGFPFTKMWWTQLIEDTGGIVDTEYGHEHNSPSVYSEPSFWLLGLSDFLQSEEVCYNNTGWEVNCSHFFEEANIDIMGKQGISAKHIPEDDFVGEISITFPDMEIYSLSGNINAYRFAYKANNSWDNLQFSYPEYRTYREWKNISYYGEKQYVGIGGSNFPTFYIQTIHLGSLLTAEEAFSNARFEAVIIHDQIALSMYSRWSEYSPDYEFKIDDSTVDSAFNSMFEGSDIGSVELPYFEFRRNDYVDLTFKKMFYNAKLYSVTIPNLFTGISPILKNKIENHPGTEIQILNDFEKFYGINPRGGIQERLSDEVTPQENWYKIMPSEPIFVYGDFDPVVKEKLSFNYSSFENVVVEAAPFDYNDYHYSVLETDPKYFTEIEDTVFKVQNPENNYNLLPQVINYLIIPPRERLYDRLNEDSQFMGIFYRMDYPSMLKTNGKWQYIKTAFVKKDGHWTESPEAYIQIREKVNRPVTYLH